MLAQCARASDQRSEGFWFESGSEPLGTKNTKLGRQFPQARLEVLEKRAPTGPAFSINLL